MMKFVLHVVCVNSADAVAKMMLAVKQGNLSIQSINIHSIDGGSRLSAVLLLEGEEGKGEWLANKLLNYPYYHSTSLMKTKE
ncbi:MAG: hypothetical protein QXS50_04335 [Candidatus Caldarchaeum sp.]